MGRNMNVSPLKISASEIYLTDAQLSSTKFAALQGLTITSIRSRFGLLVALNQGIEELFPLTDFRAATSYPQSTAAVLSRGRELIFYETKATFLKLLLDITHQRNSENAPPEIVIDPVEEIGNTNEDVCLNLFCQALNQLSEVQSSSLIVSIASGGDPQFPFNVKMTGEEVHGNSGSFRHFLAAAVDQLHGPTLNLLVPYRGTGSYSGRYFLKPGPYNFGEEKMLQFFGQLLGISLRAGIPLCLDLMPSFWLSMVNNPIKTWETAKEIDPVLWNYITTLENLTEDKFDEFLEENNHPKFTFASIGGSYIELCTDGVSRFLSWDNKEDYISLVRSCRLKEWESRERIIEIQAGLRSIVPTNFLLSTFSAADLELKICGIPHINIKYLRQHTIYQVNIFNFFHCFSLFSTYMLYYNFIIHSLYIILRLRILVCRLYFFFYFFFHPLFIS